jgi:cytochrome d ubiquinol oxidase subunit I
LLATGTWNGEVVGLNPLQAQYEQQFGPGYYVPNVFVQYWSMRVMAYGGALLFLLALVGGYVMWRRRLAVSRRFLWFSVWAVPVPFILNTAGWMLTENGRQPWIVQGLLRTADASSPSVGTATLVTSIVVFLLLYGVLAIVDWVLMTRYARASLSPPGGGAEDDVPELTY